MVAAGNYLGGAGTVLDYEMQSAADADGGRVEESDPSSIMNAQAPWRQSQDPQPLLPSQISKDLHTHLSWW